ncbi:MAG: hypothetical protein J6P98_08380 [Clostridia bacterium]|nr:hypothetical protein [Clostridia bacterium]
MIAGLLEKGLDRELLTAYLNRYAFRLKDMHEPAGLIRCIMSYQSSLYGGDPLLYLENDEDIAAMRLSAENGGFEELLREMFDFSDMSLLTVLPSKTHGDELRREEKERAEKIWAGLDEAAREELKAANDRLHAWQQADDAPEDTAKLPVLPLEEVSREPLWTPTEEKNEGGVRVLFHPVPSNGIVHLNLYFGTGDMNLSAYPALGAMTALFGTLPTKEYGAGELQKLIKTYIGRLRFSVNAASKECGRCAPFFTVTASVLEENLEKALGIVKEIITSTVFSDRAKIRETAAQLDEQFKQTVIMGGHSVGMTAVNAHYYAASAVTEAVTGVTFHRFVQRMLNEDAAIDELIALGTAMEHSTFVKSRLTCGVTAGEYPCLCALLSLPEGEPAPEEAGYVTALPEKLGIRIPAQVSFAEKGLPVSEMRGSMKVAANIIGLSFLWNRVRVQGGAYGVGLRLTDRGAMCHYTFRDPTPARSLDVFSEESAFVRGFCEGGEKLDKFIISTVGNTEPLRSPADMGSNADLDVFEGVTREHAKRLRKEMLETTEKDLIDFCAELDACAEKGAVCVVGSEKALAAIEGLTVIDA